MAEKGIGLFLGGTEITAIQNNNFVFANPFSEAVVPAYQVRNDPYSASLVTAQPFNLFSGQFGMTNYYDSVDGYVRGDDTNYSLVPSGSTSYYFASGSVVSSGSFDFATAGDYTTSVSQENSSNLGVIATSDYNIGSQDFVVEFWFNPRQNHANPPFHMFCFGSDVSGDRVLIQYSLDNTFRFYINGTNTWTTTPSFTDTLNQWYHVAFVKSGTAVYVYLNGNRIGVGSRAATVNTPPSGMWELAGVNSGNNNDGLRKTVQDYRVYIGTDKGYTGTTITVPNSIIEKT